MKKIAIILLSLFFIPLAGCIDRDDSEFPGIDYNYDEYFYCEYNGVVWVYLYNHTIIEEGELVNAFIDDGMFRMSYAHYTNGYGLGSFNFKVVNSTTNTTESNTDVSVDVEDFDTAPGGSGRNGENLYITNLSIIFTYWTLFDTNSTGSDSYDETDLLSRGLFTQDIELNRERVEIIENLMFNILGLEPDYTFVGRNYATIVS